MRSYFAHSGGKSGQWQPLREHLTEVRKQALARCPKFLTHDVSLASIFHDYGKYSCLFTERLKGLVSGLDHWSPGAHLLLKYGLSDLAGMVVHAHHVGLGEWGQVSRLRDTLVSLENKRLTLSSEQLADALKAMTDDGLEPAACPRGRRMRGTVGSMLDTRMVLSALVHADYADTARHMRGETQPTGQRLDAEAALTSVQSFVAALGEGVSSEVRAVRRDLWQAALDAAPGPTGLYELEAPTGSGKTLAMLAFALNHIVAHREHFGAGRIIVVLPFLSILDQTVEQYRLALGAQASGLLEHHSLAGSHEAAEEDGESPDRSTTEAFSESWDAPIIITTTVQLFESLFSNHPGTTRKLCSLSKAVILLDEMQALPKRLVSPTLRALSRLCHGDYGSTVVVATATQPGFPRFAAAVHGDGENIGWQPRPIARRDLGLYSRSRRYEVDWSRCRRAVAWETIADELAQKHRALCVVNTRRDARNLAGMVRDRAPASTVLHISTSMCSAHRRSILACDDIRDPEAACLLISTQCVEAGVDIDFPFVYRALAPLDSIGQAAGRCNRAGRGEGQVCVFLPLDARYPGAEYEQGAQQTMSLLGDGSLDLQDPAVFDLYFGQLYDLVSCPGSMPRLEQAIREADFPAVAKHYRIIEHRDLRHVIVPYDGAPVIPERVTSGFFRLVQPFVVDVNRADVESFGWLVSAIAGTDDWFKLSDASVYDQLFGLSLNQELPVV